LNGKATKSSEAGEGWFRITEAGKYTLEVTVRHKTKPKLKGGAKVEFTIK